MQFILRNGSAIAMPISAELLTLMVVVIGARSLSIKLGLDLLEQLAQPRRWRLLRPVWLVHRVPCSMPSSSLRCNRRNAICGSFGRTVYGEAAQLKQHVTPAACLIYLQLAE